MLVIGATSEPYLCAKKDESALVNFFHKHIHMPMPDYASRQILWPGLVTKYGAAPDGAFDWPTLAQISADYTSGQMDKVVASLLSEQRLERLQKGGPAEALTMRDFINWLAMLEPMSAETDEAIRKFGDRTPARAALAGAVEKKKKKPDSGKKGAKKGKK